MTAAPERARVIFSSVDCKFVSGFKVQNLSPVLIISDTLVSSVLPSDPPGWSLAKSSFTNPLDSRSVIARASPRTNIAVVLEVGARFSGHASLFTLVLRMMSLFRPSEESVLPVMLIRLILNRRRAGKRSRISLVSPL